MNIDLWLARTFSALAAFSVLSIMAFQIAVMLHYYRQWKRDSSAKFVDLSSNFWIAAVVGTMMQMFLYAVLDVGQALVLVTEGWGAIVGICATVLAPFLGYKAATKIATPKGGSVESSG